MRQLFQGLSGPSFLVFVLGGSFAWAQPDLTPALDVGPDRPILSGGSQVLTGFVGGHVFDVSQRLEDFDADFETKPDLGLAYQYHLSPGFALEAGFLFSPGSPAIDRGPIQVVEDVDVNAFYYTLNGVFTFRPSQRVIPYVTAGAGAVRLHVGSGGGTETELLGNFGAGLLLAANERFAVRLDVRDYVYQMSGLGADSREALNLPADFEETVQDLSFRAGLTFFLP